MMRMLLCSMVAACLLAACQPAEAPTPERVIAKTNGAPSAAGDHPIAEQDFRITITDDAEMRGFHLTLISLNAARDLCVGGAEWPDERGRMDGAADFVSLHANGQGYAMRDSGEQCGDACVRRIAPGARLEGVIGYDQFAPEAFDEGPHTLNFGAQPYFCDTGEVE
jgi:hypothetical protein